MCISSGENQTEGSGTNGRNLRPTVDPMGSIRMILSTRYFSGWTSLPPARNLIVSTGYSDSPVTSQPLGQRRFSAAGIAEHCNLSHSEHMLAKFALQGSQLVMNVNRTIVKPYRRQQDTTSLHALLRQCSVAHAGPADGDYESRARMGGGCAARRLSSLAAEAPCRRVAPPASGSAEMRAVSAAAASGGE